jgi:hypothetical protein
MVAAQPAHTIALINAGPLPPNVDIGAGPVAAGYAAVQYNGAVITAAQVTPPAFLDIVPKVVNKIAEKRQAAGGGAPVPEAAPITSSANTRRRSTCGAPATSKQYFATPLGTK